MLDLLVIGAGLAGLSAAWVAAQAGVRVRVIAKGLGCMHWSAGAVDVLGYLPGSHALIKAPLQHLHLLPEQHPYRRLGSDSLAALLASWQGMLAEAGLTYHGAKAAGRNLLLPSPVGAARPTYLAPQAQLAGDLERPEPMLIVGFQGMRDFYPKLLAENLAKQGYPARATFAPLDLISSRRDNSPIQLAHGLENAPAQARLAAALKKAVRSGERVGLPAILGVEQHATALANLQEQTGATLFEIPTLPPSAPGMRLYLALRRQLMQLGVRVEAGMEAIGFHAEGRQIRWVKTETSARPLKHHARNFLLATGGVLGGGFTSDHSGRFWEVIFRLPLTAPQERTRWFRPQFLDARGHPVFQSGVQVNQRFQPVDDEGAPVYDNLWAAGGALAHADSIRERSLEGMAIATGMAAAQAIVSCEDDKMTG